MSITLDIDSDGQWCKTFSASKVMVGREEIGINDFLILAHYVLTNTDLEPSDPRLQFVDCVRAMREEDGWNVGGKRLESNIRPIPELPQTTKGS